MTDLIITYKSIVDINNVCRSKKPKSAGFILTGTVGIFAYTFVDYGPSFKVIDKDAEDPIPFII